MDLISLGVPRSGRNSRVVGLQPRRVSGKAAPAAPDAVPVGAAAASVGDDVLPGSDDVLPDIDEVLPGSDVVVPGSFDAGPVSFDAGLIGRKTIALRVDTQLETGDMGVARREAFPAGSEVDPVHPGAR